MKKTVQKKKKSLRKPIKKKRTVGALLQKQHTHTELPPRVIYVASYHDGDGDSVSVSKFDNRQELAAFFSKNGVTPEDVTVLLGQEGKNMTKLKLDEYAFHNKYFDTTNPANKDGFFYRWEWQYVHPREQTPILEHPFKNASNPVIVDAIPAKKLTLWQKFLNLFSRK